MNIHLYTLFWYVINKISINSHLLLLNLSHFAILAICRPEEIFNSTPPPTPQAHVI